jgi:hypothetical protein
MGTSGGPERLAGVGGVRSSSRSSGGGDGGAGAVEEGESLVAVTGRPGYRGSGARHWMHRPARLGLEGDER